MYTKWFKRYLKYRIKLGGYTAYNYSGAIPADMFVRNRDGKYYYLNPTSYANSAVLLEVLTYPLTDFNNCTSVASPPISNYFFSTVELNELSYEQNYGCLITVASKSRSASFDTNTNLFKYETTTIFKSNANQTAKSIACLNQFIVGNSSTFTPTEEQIHCDDNDTYDGSVKNSVSINNTTSSVYCMREFFNLETPFEMTNGTNYTITMTKYIDVSGVVKETDITIV